MPSATPHKNGASVEAINVNKTFETTGLVLKNLNVTITPGEFVSLLGPSGCGKSTFLRLVSNLEEPDSGIVKVESFGRELFKSFVFQEAQLLPWLNVTENVALPLELSGIERSQARMRAEKTLAQVGMFDRSLLPHQLSGGMKMRVSVARALVTDPSLLLLDEPFSALDEINRFRLQEELRGLWSKQKMTILFISHSVSEAVFLSDRVLVMSSRPGEIVLDQKINLSFERDDRLRSEANYLKEVKNLTDYFRKLPIEVSL